MTAQILRFPTRGEVRLTKKQLAAHLGKSTRWVERQGFPSEMKDGRREYVLGSVLAMMDERAS